jgi:hypothetical protein
MFGIGEVATLIDSVVKRVWPDATESEAARMKVVTMELQQEFQSRISQTDVNKAEAETGSLFIAGWRPAVGWVCVCGFAYTVLHPWISWAANIRGIPLPPMLDPEPLNTLLFGMLGLGAMRTVEKTAARKK